MAGPDWTRWLLAALLTGVSVTCLLRLVRSGKEPPWHEDVGQVVAGMGMIAMVMSGLDVLPIAVWVAVFGAQAAGFGVLACRPGRHAWVAADHLLASLAMLYMVLSGMVMDMSPLSGAFGMYFVLSAGWAVGRAVTAVGGAGTMVLRRPVVIEGCRAVMGGGMAFLLFGG